MLNKPYTECQRCGRDLQQMGEYADYMHYVPGSDGVPCLEAAIGFDLLSDQITNA